MRRRGCRWLGAFVVGLLLASGCGSNDGSGTAGPPSQEDARPSGSAESSTRNESPAPPAPR